MEQQHEASTLGMWVFLVTEIMFFGGMFLAYTGLPRLVSPEAFAEASHHLDIALGRRQHRGPDRQLLTMALAVRAAQTGAAAKTQVVLPDRRRCSSAPSSSASRRSSTRDKFERPSSCPARTSTCEGTASRHGARSSSRSTSRMTGLHALHMIIGIGIMTRDR